MATKPFKGKDDRKEELAEAKAVRSGKVSPKQYAKKEKAEGERISSKALEKRGKDLKSGKLTPDRYAKGPHKK